MNIFKQISGIIADVFVKYREIWEGPSENAFASTQSPGMDMEAYCYYMGMNAVYLKRKMDERLAHKFMRAFFRHNRKLFRSDDPYQMNTWEILKERTLDAINRYKRPGECRGAYMNRLQQDTPYDSTQNPPISTADSAKEKTIDSQMERGIEIVEGLLERIGRILEGVNPKYFKRQVNHYQRTLPEKILRVAGAILLFFAIGYTMRAYPFLILCCGGGGAAAFYYVLDQF